VSVETSRSEEGVPAKTEYRIWNPFRSKLAAGILGGLETIYMKPGTKVLYLGAASGTSVSHVSDLVGPTGAVYAVEFSHRSGRDLINMATRRTNIIPIVEDVKLLVRLRLTRPALCTDSVTGPIPYEIPHARANCRCRLLRRRTARSGPYRGSQFQAIPETRWRTSYLGMSFCRGSRLLFQP
jgi:hypothetical protein